MSHISDSNYHEGTTLSLSLPECLSTHTVLSPNKHLFHCKKKKRKKKDKIENVAMGRH